MSKQMEWDAGLPMYRGIMYQMCRILDECADITSYRFDISGGVLVKHCVLKVHDKTLLSRIYKKLKGIVKRYGDGAGNIKYGEKK